VLDGAPHAVPGEQAGKFLEKYGQMELFPVKMQVPLIMTIHIVMLSKCDTVLVYHSACSRSALRGRLE
jgi:hypothetical protein